MDPDEVPVSLSTAVVEALAAKEGTDPTDIDEPLGAVIDSDALDNLFDPPTDDGTQSRGRVTFVYSGYEVTAHSDGHVELVELAETAEMTRTTPSDSVN